jgi:hypothetical protein
MEVGEDGRIHAPTKVQLIGCRRPSSLWHTMRMLWMLLAVLAMAPAWAMAGEPAGFDRFTFGITRNALVGDPLFLARCQPAPRLMQVGVGIEGFRITCPTYNFVDLGVMRAALLFSAEDRLVGYVVYLAKDRQPAVRAKIETLYGPPTSQLEEHGRTIAWLWPSGTEASLTVLCRGTDGCLTVKAKAPKKQ